MPAPTLARAGTSIDAAVYTDASAHCSFAPDVADSLVATAVWCRRDLTSRQGSCGPIPVFPGSLFTPPQTVTKTFEPLTRASEDQTMPVDASPIGHPHSSALDLRPPLLSRWPSFLTSLAAITHGLGGKSQIFGVISQDKACRSSKQRHFTSANLQNDNAVRLLPRHLHDERAPLYLGLGNQAPQ